MVAIDENESIMRSGRKLVLICPCGENCREFENAGSKKSSEILVIRDKFDGGQLGKAPLL